jgi:hypothetical protein
MLVDVPDVELSRLWSWTMPVDRNRRGASTSKVGADVGLGCLVEELGGFDLGCLAELEGFGMARGGTNKLDGR